jgi:hypothetical protein
LDHFRNYQPALQVFSRTQKPGEPPLRVAWEVTATVDARLKGGKSGFVTMRLETSAGASRTI